MAESGSFFVGHGEAMGGRVLSGSVWRALLKLCFETGAVSHTASPPHVHVALARHLL